MELCPNCQTPPDWHGCMPWCKCHWLFPSGCLSALSSSCSGRLTKTRHSSLVKTGVAGRMVVEWAVRVKAFREFSTGFLTSITHRDGQLVHVHSGEWLWGRRNIVVLAAVSFSAPSPLSTIGHSCCFRSLGIDGERLQNRKSVGRCTGLTRQMRGNWSHVARIGDNRTYTFTTRNNVLSQRIVCTRDLVRPHLILT